IAPNPFTDWVYMIAVQSGGKRIGHWIVETQNILEDCKKTFGEDPPAITGIAIMTDSDNTGGSATAFYGDIILKRKSPWHNRNKPNLLSFCYCSAFQSNLYFPLAERQSGK